MRHEERRGREMRCWRCREGMAAMPGIELEESAILVVIGMGGAVMGTALIRPRIDHGLDLVIGVNEAVNERRKRIEQDREACDRRPDPKSASAVDAPHLPVPSLDKDHIMVVKTRIRGDPGSHLDHE